MSRESFVMSIFEKKSFFEKNIYKRKKITQIINFHQRQYLVKNNLFNTLNNILTSLVYIYIEVYMKQR